MLHIYKASAGSGKTFTLTKEYLKLLLGKRDPETKKWKLRKAPDGANRHILAITFTNKATEEMTRRIIKELAILGGREPGDNSSSPYLKDFCELFGASPDEIRRLASLTLDDLLGDFVFFNVSTIDAFFQSVLRIFAREVEMPADFQLELNNNYTIAVGVNEMFSSINMGEPVDPVKKREYKWLHEWLTKFLQRMFDDGKAVNLLSRKSSPYTDLIKTFSNLIDEDFKIHSKEIIGYLENISRLMAFEDGLSTEVSELGKEITRVAKIVMQYGDYNQVNRYVRQRIETWAEGNILSPSGTCIKAISERSSRFAKKYADSGKVALDLEDALIEVCRLALRHAEMVERKTLLIKSINVFGLLGCLLKFIDAYCKANNLMMLSETNSLLRDIINDDDTPFVYERLGYYLHNFLIDEFQDTSRMQWENLRPLIMESLSHDHEDLVIGDEKQCIYRFRNSDPSLLGHEIGEDVENVYGDDLLSVEGTDISHNNNWRSSREVVAFNNSIFHALAKLVGDEETYSNVIQQISSRRDKNIPGHVSLMFEPAGEDASPALADEADDEREDSEESAFALDAMMTEIDRLLSAGYQQKDIAILVRTHTEGEKVINRILETQNSPDWRHGPVEVTSTDSVSVSASPAVKMIVEILRLTQMPQIVQRTDFDVGPDATPYDIINPAYRRTRLLYCYEYYLHSPVEDEDGNKRRRSNAEALAAAVEALRGDVDIDRSQIDAIRGASQEIYELLNFTRRELDGSSETSDNEAAEALSESQSADEDKRLSAPTLSTIVEDIISRFVAPDVLQRETVYLTAFQDIVYDFCQRGNSDISSFLEWWDRGGCSSGLSTTAENQAINVMTIHQSKGLEFPCVIIPFANWELVTYNSTYRTVNRWFSLDPADFPGIAPEVVPPMMPMEFTKKLCDTDIFRKQADEYKKQQRIDALNVAYVAFTRAVNELIVIAPKGSKRSDENLDDYLRDAVDLLTSQAIADDESLADGSRDWVLPLGERLEAECLEVGEPTRPVDDCKDEADETTIILPAYNPKVNDNLLALTKADVDYFDFDDPRCRGDFLHKVMSSVRHRDQLPLALRRAAYRARLSAKQTEECFAILSKAVNDDRVARWFDDYERVLNEYTIVSESGYHRPDRVVWTADGHIDIIDFKFGEPRKEYFAQVRDYVALMSQAGYKDVRGFIWYVIDGNIVEV